MKNIFELYDVNNMLIVGNAWDAMSALVMEQQGFKLIGTTSWGVANSLGKNDGEHITFESYLQVVKNILSVVSIPVSVDIESGFSLKKEEVIVNVLTLAELGCMGINIEDSTTSYDLKDPDDFSILLSDLRKSLNEAGYDDFFINARIDTYIALKNNPLNETIMRAKCYQNAGTNGIFVPLISDELDIKELMENIHLPLNIMSLPHLTDINKLEKLGVRRFSVGNAISDNIIAQIEKNSEMLLHNKTSHHLYDHDDIKTKFNT